MIGKAPPAQRQTNNRPFENHSGNYNLWLLCIALLFSLYDIFSTILSIKSVGYSYEGNIFVREIIRTLGVPGFAGVKFSLTFLGLFAVFTIIRYKNSFGWKSVKMFQGIYVGTIISSLFVATSNLYMVFAGSSFYLLDLNALQTGLILLFVPPLAGFFLDVRLRIKEK